MRRHPIDENRGDALIFTGVGSLFTAIAAVLLEYPTFTTIFAFFGAFRACRCVAGRERGAINLVSDFGRGCLNSRGCP